MSKVSVYESNTGDMQDNFTLIEEQSGGNFMSLKTSFKMITDLREKVRNITQETCELSGHVA